MTCEACSTAAQRESAMFHAGCRGCMARAAARSPQYRQARDTGRQDSKYRALLDTYGVSHDEVRAAAEADFEAKA